MNIIFSKFNIYSISKPYSAPHLLKVFLYTAMVALLIIFTQCASSPKLIRYVNFGDKSFPSTETNKVRIYTNRLEIGREYVEIGVILVQGNVKINKVLELAGSKGADGIVKDGNNYVTIIFVESNNEGNDEKIRT